MKQATMLLLAAALLAPAKTRPLVNPPGRAAAGAARPAPARAKRHGLRSWVRRAAALEPRLAMRLSGWGIPGR